MIDIEIQISISERLSGWAINYPNLVRFHDLLVTFMAGGDPV